MFARTVRIKHSAPAKEKIVMFRFGLQPEPQLVFAARIGGRGHDRCVFLRQWLVADLVLDARAEAENMTCAKLTNLSQEADARFEKTQVLRGFEINPGRGNPGHVQADVGAEGGNVFPWGF